MTDEQAVQLIRAIRAHSELELSSIRDAGNYGADSGFGGFTYTADGADFYDANEDLIYDLLRDDADSMGYDSPDAMVATFNHSDMLDTPDGRKCLLAWFALEQAGRWLEDRRYERTGGRS